MKKILMVLADGFEEIEALLPVDFLRRLSFEVTLSGLMTREVKGAHGIIVKTDILLKDVVSDFDALILPGGLPGATNLRDTPMLINIVKQFYEKNRLIAAICAAPIVLDKADILSGKRHTAYPSFKNSFSDSVCTDNRIEIDANIITGKGAGASPEFALAIAKYLGKENEGKSLYSEMFFD